MFNSFIVDADPASIEYPITDNHLPFAEYLARTRAIIATRRLDLANSPNPQKIIEANSPFELVPTQPIKSGNRYKYGVLLIHGLLDCPFSMRDVGARLQAAGVLCRSVLLPGQGTKPTDLLKISYKDWMQ